MAPSRSSKPAIPDRDGHRLARLAREAIDAALGGPAFDGPVPAGCDGSGASFVTLAVDGELRGCVGSPLPRPSLVEGAMDHARAAAFHDRRFDPLRREELSRLAVEVSVLSPLRPLACANEEELLIHRAPISWTTRRG